MEKIDVEKDYLLNIKVRNNKIIKLMREKNINSGQQLAKQIHKISRENRSWKAIYRDLMMLLNMKETPLINLDANTENSGNSENTSIWRPVVLDLAIFLDAKPEDLFNEQQLYFPVDDNKAERELSTEQMKLLSGTYPQQPLLPEESVFNDDLKKIVEGNLKKLTPKEKDVIERRFGIGDYTHPQTLEEIKGVYNLSRQTIINIEARALRKLRRPFIANELESFDAEDNLTNSEKNKIRIEKIYHKHKKEFHNLTDTQKQELCDLYDVYYGSGDCGYNEKSRNFINNYNYHPNQSPIDHLIPLVKLLPNNKNFCESKFEQFKKAVQNKFIQKVSMPGVGVSRLYYAAQKDFYITVGVYRGYNDFTCWYKELDYFINKLMHQYGKTLENAMDAIALFVLKASTGKEMTQFELEAFRNPEKESKSA